MLILCSECTYTYIFICYEQYLPDVYVQGFVKSCFKNALHLFSCFHCDIFVLWRVCVRARMCYWMYSKNWKLDSMLQNVTAHLTLNSQRYKKSSFLIEAMGVEEEVGLGKTSIKCILIQSNTNTASSISKNICFS